MTNPQLMTHDGSEFGVLIKPVVDVKNDLELYKAVDAAGQATVAVYDGASFSIKEQRTLNPVEFALTWKGD